MTLPSDWALLPPPRTCHAPVGAKARAAMKTNKCFHKSKIAQECTSERKWQICCFLFSLQVTDSGKEIQRYRENYYVPSKYERVVLASARQVVRHSFKKNDAMDQSSDQRDFLALNLYLKFVSLLQSKTMDLRNILQVTSCLVLE